MAVNSVPNNKNFLSPLGFKFTLSRAPTLSYNVQTARIPGIRLGEIETPTPFLPIAHSSKVTYDPLQVTFRVNEDMTDYLEIYNWMIGLGSPVSFDQYKALNGSTGSQTTLFSDITLMIMSSSMRPNLKVTFYDAFPTLIGDLDFNTTDTDVNYIECSVEFKYLRYDIELVG